MENLLLSLLTALLNNNPELKRTLREFCVFYRENRDIFAAFLNPSPEPPAPEPEKSTECPPKKDEEKDRPEETIHNVRMLEEFLRRAV